MRRCSSLLTVCMTSALMFVSNLAMAQYHLTNLDSNQVGKASHTDPLIVNAWGMVHAPGSPWWISDENSGWSTLYAGTGQQVQQLKVLIPTAGENGPGSPTGIVFNGSNDFQIQAWNAPFLFATMDGTIQGWVPQVNFNEALIAVDNSKAGAMYTGLAITNKTTGNFLYAADMAGKKVDIFDATFKNIKSFTDATLPSNFAPFGIRDINGLVYVTFADVNGGPGGFVEQFKEDGTPVTPGKPLISGAPLNQPWGIAAAPPNFGRFSNTLLIANNTNTGTIHAFDPFTGQARGTITNEDGEAIVIDQLWAIDFGDGLGKNGAANQLFFTAGPKNNLVGTFGRITFAPE
jgi:uncharacterized protein (TIGR03118 family)